MYRRVRGPCMVVAPDGARTDSRESMAQPPYVMRSAGERQVVRDAIVSLCRQRGWRLLALHVRTNHVHAVVNADRDPGRVMSDMKSRASRELTRAGFDDATRRRWTRHGSTLHLFAAGFVEHLRVGLVLKAVQHAIALRSPTGRVPVGLVLLF
jgi:REP element-mobilizing transposase RayT